MSKSKKTIVIETIFDRLYDPATQTFSRTVVTSDDLEDAKRFCNATYQTGIKLDSNPFNFMKDIVRAKNGSKIWPQRLHDLGIGGQQRTGDGAVFEFVFRAEGEADGLLEDFQPNADTPALPVQSLSLPLASKMLGRQDESWLLQVAVNLRIIESHFAIGANKQIEALELSHLQMDIKLRNVQIDALFLAQHTADADGAQQGAIITVEAKQGNQRILTEQIARQVVAAFESTKTDLVIPVAISAIRGKGVYVVEFKAVKKADLGTFKTPVFHRDAMFVLQPAVKGI